jgi:hypothetical protein
MSDSTPDLETGEAGRDRAGEGLVGIGSSDIEERVTAFGCERFLQRCPKPSRIG